MTWACCSDWIARESFRTVWVFIHRLLPKCISYLLNNRCDARPKTETQQQEQNANRLIMWANAGKAGVPCDSLRVKENKCIFHYFVGFNLPKSFAIVCMFLLIKSKIQLKSTQFPVVLFFMMFYLITIIWQLYWYIYFFYLIQIFLYYYDSLLCILHC